MGRTTNPKSKEKEPAPVAVPEAATAPAEVVEEEYSVEKVIDRRCVYQDPFFYFFLTKLIICYFSL